jgi:hypothetical protein
MVHAKALEGGKMIVYKKIEWNAIEDETEDIRMVNCCAAVNNWAKGVHGLKRIISIVHGSPPNYNDHTVEIWYEVS